MAKEVNKCTIVSGAPDDNLEFFARHIDRNSYIIAADSGYKKLESIGITPDIIIGDFDSSVMPDTSNIIKLEVEKAYSDTFSAVRYAVNEGYSNIEILGAIGSRLDHTWANILCLDYCRTHKVKCRIINDKNRISLIEKEALINKDYQYFSLFAFLEDCKGVNIKGAHYTADFYDSETLDFNISDQIGVSNFVEDDFATVTVEKGVLLLIESND